MLAYQRVHARVNQSLEFYVIHSRKSEVKYIHGPGADGGKITVEEDEVQDAFILFATWLSVEGNCYNSHDM